MLKRIERFFDGKCIGCGTVNIFNNLASLVFHHLDPIIKDSEISALLHLSCEMIYEILKKEKVVCLCANCHSLIHSNIHLHFEELFNDDFFQNISSELYLEQFKEEYVKKYNKILKNMNNFNYKDLDIISPLKSELTLIALRPVVAVVSCVVVPIPIGRVTVPSILIPASVNERAPSAVIAPLKANVVATISSCVLVEE